MNDPKEIILDPTVGLEDEIHPDGTDIIETDPSFIPPPRPLTSIPVKSN